jgi:hypothetical protein
MDVFDTTPLHEDVQRAEVQLHASLIWTVNKHEWSGSLPRKTHNINLLRGWVGPTIAVTGKTVWAPALHSRRTLGGPTIAVTEEVGWTSL